MIDLRIYRFALLPALAAAAILMFSLGSVPGAKRSRLAPNTLDGERAAATASEIARLAPDRRPGSAGDAKVASLVRQRFTAIQGAQVTEQAFSGDFHGDQVDMRNVVLALPGQSDRRVVLMAHRDEASGDGLAASAAATATLLEIASSFSGSTHHKTLVFVSTDGGSAAALGARRFAEDYPGNDQVDGIVSLEQPGAAKPRPPFVVPWSTGSDSTAIQLTRSAQAAVRDETGRSTGAMGTFGQLVQLAIPSGLGEQGPVIDTGFDAVSISSAGEQPLTPAQSGLDSFSATSVGKFGRATLSLMLALDASPGRLLHGPATHLGVAGNLLPGWTLTLLALALILPVAAVAVDGGARSRRRGEPVLRLVAWTLGRSLPFVAFLLALYLLSFVTALPSPAFPFDSREYGVGVVEAVALVLAAACLVGVGYLYRPLTPPPGTRSEALAVAVAATTTGALFLLWLIQPYLALLLVPALHLWQLPSLPRIRPGFAVAFGAVLAGVVLPILALVQLADRFDLGTGIVWDLLLMVTGGHIGLVEALLACVLAGCAVATIATGTARGRERFHGVDR